MVCVFIPPPHSDARTPLFYCTSSHAEWPLNLASIHASIPRITNLDTWKGGHPCIFRLLQKVTPSILEINEATPPKSTVYCLLSHDFEICMREGGQHSIFNIRLAAINSKNRCQVHQYVRLFLLNGKLLRLFCLVSMEITTNHLINNFALKIGWRRWR